MNAHRIGVLWAALSCIAAAQNVKSNGYVFIAPGAATTGGYSSGSLQIGAGGEGIIGKGIGVGGEFTVLGPQEAFNLDTVMMTVSPNVYYHFIRSGSRKLDPFVTGGYSLLFRSGHANLYNFGGGVNYWFRRNIALRVEFRDHVSQNCCGSALHLWGVRVGMTFH